MKRREERKGRKLRKVSKISTGQLSGNLLPPLLISNKYTMAVKLILHGPPISFNQQSKALPMCRCFRRS